MQWYTFRVQRFHPESDYQPREVQYEVELQEDASVLEGLHFIRQHHDPSLAYRYACRSAVCGSCAVRVNGEIRLACRTKMWELKTQIVTVKPLPTLSVIKDLVVDLKPFWDAYKKIQPWLISAEGKRQKEILITEKTSKIIEKFITCILCAGCYAGCLVTRRERCYLGPQAMQEAYRFLCDPRDEASEQRLKMLDSDSGLWGCDALFRCVDVCPWDLKPAESIFSMRRMVTVDRLKRAFSWGRSKYASSAQMKSI